MDSTATAIINGNLIDATGADPLTGATVLIEEDVIEYAGPRNGVTIPEQCHIIDAAGKTIMPGLIDLHVHLIFGDDDILAPQHSLPPFLDKPLTLFGIKGFALARKALGKGFTTLRDCGDVGWLAVGLREAVESGIVEGPRIVACGQFLTPTAGHWDFLPPWLNKTDVMNSVVNGVEDVRRAVRLHAKMRTDWVKFCATGGVMNAFEKTHCFNTDELAALIDEAHGKEKLVSAHCIHNRGTLDAVRAGVDSVEHGSMLTEEIVELLVDKETHLIPTLSAPFGVVNRGSEIGLPQIYIDKCKPLLERHVESFQMALKAGVKIACGSDAGMTSVAHGNNAYELELMVECGMTPMQAIQAATRQAAAALRIDSLGTVEKGKWADLIVVDGDPLTDIKILQNENNISLVIKKGKICFDRD